MLPVKKQIYLILAAFFSLFILAHPAQADGPTNFANCRLGTGGVTGNVTGYDMAQLKMGLHLDWQSTPPPGLPSDVEYIRTVRVHQVKECGTYCVGAYKQPPTYTVSPDLTTLSTRVKKVVHRVRSGVLATKSSGAIGTGEGKMRLLRNSTLRPFMRSIRSSKPPTRPPG